MAKQTFTTGQVLTAAQMTSLQQTAMGGGSTTAKTASYVLVAADAGTVVQMNSAGATTITVNTALFAAGDTVQIQNVGTGVCTVTAGTATVSTSAVLALKQYDAGSLYFNSTSAALFFAADAADNTSPLTTKGDLYGFSTLNARIPIGTNNQVLTADSAEALGLKWATPAGGGGKLLAVVQASYSGQISSATTTYADTGLTATTAALATTGSRVKIDLSMYVSPRSNVSGNGVKLQLLRGATVLTEITADAGYNGMAQENRMNVGFSYVDSPATVSATTYKVQYANAQTATGVYFSVANTPCYIILSEIGA